MYRKLARSRHFTHALSSALSVILLSDIAYKHFEKRENDKQGKNNSKIISKGGGGGSSSSSSSSSIGGGGGGMILNYKCLDCCCLFNHAVNIYDYRVASTV